MVESLLWNSLPRRVNLQEQLIEPGVGSVFRVVAWDPRVLSSSPIGRWINTPGGWLSLSSFLGRRNEYQFQCVYW